MRTELTRGFTFIEIVVVGGILATITGLTVVNLTGSQRRSYLNAHLSTLVAGMKSQQLKSMTGAREGGATANAYGIYFGNNSYTMFRGPSYSAGATSNFTVMLDGNIVLTNVSFPGSQISFATGSGELVIYTAGSSSFTLRNTIDGEQKTVTVNRYGVITSIN